MFELKLLDYHKILNILSSYCFLNKTKDGVLSLEPIKDKDSILCMLKEAYEAKNCLYRNTDFDLYDFNLDFTIDRLRIGSILNKQEFIEIRKLIIDSSKLYSYYKKCESFLDDGSVIKSYFSNLSSLKETKDLIDFVFDFEGNILDTASSELNKIRRNIRVLESDLNSKLNQILKEYSSKLSESIITIRSGHKVIPIKAEYKSLIKGVVYDESASGQTLYIEPYICAEIEGKLGVLREQENKEIERILSKLSIDISAYYTDILNNYSMVIKLDDCFARGKYAKDINAEIPIITDNTIDLIDARHPLIDKGTVVANTISFKNKKTIIITGPNTGGKTVVLKTMGLLSLMVQSGILIPVKEGSSIKIFDGIYADIGDEQSIEQSLSTFSSHMSRIVNILDNVESESLVLLDELGSGTDPKEGASLAISILNFLRRLGPNTICTTHYPELKLYAYNNDDILNASVEFNAETLKPTFKLLIGVSGKSNAFLISKRLGLNENIIQEAEGVNLEFKDEESLLIQRLEKESIELLNEKEKYQELIKELENERNSNREFFKKEKEKLNKKMDNISSKEAEILEKTQKEATKLLDEIKEIKKDLLNNKLVKENEIIDLRGKTNALYKDKYVKKNYSNKEIKVGDKVRILAFNEIGTVSAIKNNTYSVSFGSMNSNFKKTEIEYVEVVDNVKLAQEKREKHTSNLKLNVSHRLDLRGMRYEDALLELDKFIDDALITNLETVEIIHGFGTLALRNMVIKYCNTHSSIKSYRSGEEHEGGRGVTVISLK